MVWQRISFSDSDGGDWDDGAKFYTIHAADSAPQLVGYNWGQHLRTVALLVPEADCGCGMKPSEIARKAAEHGVDFVQISIPSAAKTSKISQNKANTGEVHLIDPKIFASYCSDDHAVALEIHNGRIFSRVSGNLPRDYFNRFAS